ncbi:hypothetical protein B0H11DRAFT_2169221 [Mycena galericulata]|nr:hypothetical protein B0H11DRAFT_2169221 [Mycena galericulata]
MLASRSPVLGPSAVSTSARGGGCVESLSSGRGDIKDSILLAMANLIRSSKSGCEWSVNELAAYHISVKDVQPEMFFRSGAKPSLDHLDPEILTCPPDTEGLELSESTARYLGYLDLANKGSFIVDFARETLHLLGFSERNLILSSRYTIPLAICGATQIPAQTDVCLLQCRPTLVLLVLVEDKVLAIPTSDPQAHAIAEAIAAFEFNNQKRVSLGREPLASMTIPCITMSGTRPTFYLVPVTRELSEAVAVGQYPSSETVVSMCVITPAYAKDGMGDAQYRQMAFQRFLAFKTLAKSHWEAISKDL